MSDPSPEIRDKRPSRVAAFFRRQWSWKDIALILLGLSFVSMAGYAFRGPISEALAKFRAGAQGGETVSVFDVIVDRENRQYFDILFDKPLGQGHVGEVLDPAPASISPSLGGSWKWQDTNALRFQPSGGLPVASEFKVELDPAKVLQEGQVFTGETTFTVKTDKFLVEEVTVFEEPALEGKAKVVFRGEMRFNYPVDPEVLAPLVKVTDPEQAEPIPVALETDYNNRVIGYRTEPVQKQRDERKVQLVIGGTLTPQSGNAPLGEDYVKEIAVGSSTKLTVRGVETEPGPRESTIKVTFSSPISAAVAEKYVKIDPAEGPPVKVRFAADRNELSITGEMQPGASYTLTIGAGMPATDEAVLAEEYREEIQLTDLDPTVGFQSQGMFLWSQGRHAVALEAVNVPKVRMTLDRVYLNNLFFLFQYGGFYEGETGWFGELNHALGDRLKDETLDVGGRKNKKRVYPLDLDKFVDTREPGLYRVSVGKPDDYEAAQRWLLLTDLGAVAKRGPGEILVWVSSLKDLSPVGGAKVTLISDQNQTLASGTTDGSGIWRVYDPKALSKGTPYMVTIEKGDDFSFLLLDQMAIDPTGLDVGGAEAVGEGYTAFLYGERDIYRPGEKAEGLAIVRDGALRIPPSMPALLRHRDPQGRELETRRLTTNDKGLASFSLDLPAYALTGSHTLELEVAEKIIGQYRFQVEEFVPDRISVEIVPPKEKVGPGQKLAYQVQSNYLFGAPAAGLPVETRVRLVDSSFSAKGFEGFSFRNGDRKLEDNEILSEDGKLDDEGRAGFEVQMPAGAPVPSSLEAVITARVQEQGGRGVAALARVQVHPYPYYVGLRRVGGGEEGFADPGKPAAFEYVAVSPDGKEVPSGGLRADLFEDRWNTVLRRTSSGSWRYETTRDPVLIASKPIASGRGRGTFEMTPRDYGSYRVVLTDPETQASAQAEFYAAGWGTSPWAMKNPSRLELDLDKTEYAPGDTAVVQVRAPFAGKLLVTVERDRVLDTEVYELTGNTARIELPVRAEYRPNAYVTATLVRPVGDLEPGSAGRAFGAVPLPVNRTANRLAPQITAPDVMRPNRDLTVSVKTAPHAVVTVAAVDEGILQLIAQKTPDPFEFFYRKLALGVTSYDTFSLLMPELKNLPPGGGEGAEGMGQYVRTEGIRRVQPVAFWSGPLTADGNGNAKVTFKVPEFQGALRIMAVAIDGDRFGSAFRLTRVRDPLVLLPTLPRLLSFGETLQVPVTVRNDTGKPGAIQIGLTAQGPVSVEKPAVQSIDIPVGREKTAYFTVKTGDASGNVRFVATAAGNGEQSRSTTEVGIRPDLPEMTVENAGSVNQAALEIPAKDADRYRPETLRRTLRLGPLPLVQFAGKLEHLLHYPYGCIEQTTSSAFPLIYLGDIAKAFDPALFDPKKGHADPAALVQAGLARIATMQLQDGGFAMWPGGRETHLWGSIYATHFIVEAKRAGHPVPDSLYRKALGWLAGEVKAKGTYGSDELQRMAYGLYVLARAGKADLGTMDHIREKHAKELSAESRALLAAAYASAGNPRATQSLAANIGAVEEVQRQTGGNFNSAIRNRALLLLALLDANPKSPQIPQLVDRLARDAQSVREYDWWTTQEESFTLLALGQFIQRQAQQPPYSGTVFAGGRPLGKFTNKTVTFPGITGTGPIRLQMDPGYKPGAAFFSVMTRGVPTDDAFKPSNAGLEIQREFLNRDGGALDLANVRQGDLVAIKTRVRSVSGPVQNVVIVNLLPSGLEVENPRLQTTEQLPWVSDANLQPDYLDLRDDRILLFTDLPADSWQTFYTLVRAVAPGQFRLPPVQVEAMYNPALRATGERGRMEVKTR